MSPRMVEVAALMVASGWLVRAMSRKLVGVVWGYTALNEFGDLHRPAGPRSAAARA